jgi:hypothetical protein
MNTVQEPLTGSLPQKGYLQDALFAGDKVPPFPFFIENPAELNHTDLPTNKDNTTPNFNSVSPDTNPLPDRCQFTFSDGRQCRMGRSEIHPSLCRFHAEREDQLFGDPAPGGNVVGATLDLPELHSACRDLTTAAGVNRALAQVFRLLAQRRISRQEAATFGHLAQLLLRSISLARSSRESDDATSIVIPSSDESHQQDELSSVNKVKRESRDLSASVPVNKVVPSPPSADERGSDCAPRMPSWKMAPDSSPHAQATPAPNSQGPQNEHFHKPHLQLTQNEHLPNFST